MTNSLTTVDAHSQHLAPANALQTLYSSENVHVSCRLGHGSSRIVVTFESLTFAGEVGRKAFADEFLQVNGYDSIHFAGRGNDWYQYADMPDALAAATVITSRYRSVVTYGLSMGGYAALNFSRDLNASLVIAISPQFSVDAAQVPFEHRWDAYVKQLDFCCDRIGEVSTSIALVLIYDPYNDDRRHAEMIAPHFATRHVLVPYGAHPVVQVLIEAGLFSSLIRDILADAFDHEAFDRTLEEICRGSPVFAGRVAVAHARARAQNSTALTGDARVGREMLYESENLRVSCRIGRFSRRIVVTFESLTRAGLGADYVFGDDFLTANGFDSVHVAGQGNDWYQYPDMADGLAAVLRVTSLYESVVTYGFSMGAYAAINFSQALGADTVIAISPQYSLDPAKVPFEHRWDAFIADRAFICDDIDKLVPGDTVVNLIYDPFDADIRHAELISRHVSARHIHVPYGSHPVMQVLIEMKLLSSMVRDLLGDTFDQAAFDRRVAEASAGSPVFHGKIAIAHPRARVQNLLDDTPASKLGRETLYVSDTLHVSCRLGRDSARIVVTFGSLATEAVRDDKVFADELLTVNRFDSIHVAATANHWYQCADMDDALEAVLSVARDYRSIATYGIGMGGYGAVNFAAALGADLVIAISPQFSIDPALVPFERRWDAVRAVDVFRHDRIATFTASDRRVFLIYDPHDPDRLHAELIGRHVAARHIEVPYGSSPITQGLIETGLLSSLVHDLLTDNFAPESFTARLRERSETSPVLLSNFAMSLDLGQRPRRVALMRRVVALRPGDPIFVTNLTGDLIKLGFYAEAVQHLEALRDSWPNHPFLAHYASCALERVGRHRDALETAEMALSMLPNNSYFRRNLAWLRKPWVLRYAIWYLGLYEAVSVRKL